VRSGKPELQPTVHQVCGTRGSESSRGYVSSVRPQDTSLNAEADDNQARETDGDEWHSVLRSHASQRGPAAGTVTATA